MHDVYRYEQRTQQNELFIANWKQKRKNRSNTYFFKLNFSIFAFLFIAEDIYNIVYHTSMKWKDKLKQMHNFIDFTLMNMLLIKFTPRFTKLQSITGFI